MLTAIHYFIKGPDSLNHQIKPENSKVSAIEYLFHLKKMSGPAGENLLLNFLIKTIY